MRVLRIVALMMTCAIALAFTSCAKPEYWVAGLTLPPGSTSMTTTDGSMGAEGMPPLPFGGKIKRTKTVSFGNGNGWDAVASHIDLCMKRQGYEESMSGLNELAAGMPKGTDMDFSNMMRMYSKSGSKYTVGLMNMSATMEQAAKATGQSMPGNMSSMGIGEFMLVIYEMEK